MVTYEWNSGSVPPPYYLEVRVVIRSDGSGTLEGRPDYPANRPPVWTWTFAVPAAALDGVAAAVADAEARGAPGEPPGGPPHTGGAVESVVAERAGQEGSLPPDPALVAAVRRAVPSEVWAELGARRDRTIERASPDPPPEGG